MSEQAALADMSTHAALKPFAEAAENLSGTERDADNLWESPEAMMLTVGDLRRAARAFAVLGASRPDADTSDRTGVVPGVSING